MAKVEGLPARLAETSPCLCLCLNMYIYIRMLYLAMCIFLHRGIQSRKWFSSCRPRHVTAFSSVAPGPFGPGAFAPGPICPKEVDLQQTHVDDTLNPKSPRPRGKYVPARTSRRPTLCQHNCPLQYVHENNMYYGTNELYMRHSSRCGCCVLVLYMQKNVIVYFVFAVFCFFLTPISLCSWERTKNVIKIWK